MTNVQVFSIPVLIVLGGFATYFLGSAVKKDRDEYNKCAQECGITRSMFYEDKCYCAHAMGWLDPMKKLTIKCPKPKVAY